MREHPDHHPKPHTTAHPGWPPHPLWASRAVVVFLGSLAMLAVSAATASAAVTHEYLPAVSKKITEGVPVSSGAPLPGPLGRAERTAADSGYVWVAQEIAQGNSRSRVDEFDAASGAYLGRQLVEEGGVEFLHEGLAVGHATGEEQVYVGARKEGSRVVAVYGPAGKLQGVWEGAHTANKSFTQSAGGRAGVLNDVAVDGSGNLQTAGDVYVATAGFEGFSAFSVVDVLKPEAHGKEGEAVGQILGTCEAPGTCAGSEVPFSAPRRVAVSGASGDVLVLDGSLVDVFEPVSGMPGVYSFLFTITGTPNQGAFVAPADVAVDPSTGNIDVVEGAANVVDEFDPAGHFVGRLTGTPTGPSGRQRPFPKLLSVAVDPVSHSLFVGGVDQEKEVGVVAAFGPDVVVPDVAVVEPPEGLTPTGAVLRGSVNPDAAGAASCEFEYGTSVSYGLRVSCTVGVSEGSVPVAVKSGALEGLAPDTTYHYRLDASNAHGANTGECPEDCGQFTTSGPGISGESVSEVAGTSVTLSASIDPHGRVTSYYFQYSTADTAGCGEPSSGCVSTPAAPGAPLGAGTEPVGVSRHVQGLAPGSVYHYRVVAVSEWRPGTTQEFAGPDQTFTTQLASAGLPLLDGRQWDLLSPANKQGATPLPIQDAGIAQASASGDGMSYRATRPTETAVQGYAEAVQVLSTRGTGGWGSQDISPPHASAVGAGVGEGSEYRFFSPDLGRGVVEPFGEFSSLAPCVSSPDSERTPYIRDGGAQCEGRPGMFQPLVTGEDVPADTKFGGSPSAITGEVHFDGASQDLSHVVLSSKVALTAPPNAGETAKTGLYEWSATRPGPEALQLISVLPEGKLASGTAQLGFEDVIARNAISEDGTRVIWSEPGSHHLYLRDMTRGQTIQVDVPEAACLANKTCGAEEAQPRFQSASRDGSRVFFTDTQRLVEGAGEVPLKPDLYECEVETSEAGLACRLRDLSMMPAGLGEGADVQGVLPGMSEDGSWVYFVANGALSKDATAGNCHKNTPPPGATCNLYVEHFDGSALSAPRLVAVLGGEDWPDWKGTEGQGLASMTARVSGNGRFVAFMSDRSLTGYDNRDAVTGRPDQEVFLYDTQGAGGAGRLVCASCNPSGARPVGVEFEKLLHNGIAGVGAQGLWSEAQGIAANVPGWTAFGVHFARYQSRYLSDDGRLFFNSRDGLVPQDVNNNEDVYEFEPVGVGGCLSSSESFEGLLGGCVGLVSSGTAHGESGFLDASETGNDVFFLTEGRLAGQDVDTALDVYDAHVCSGAVPCLAPGTPPRVCGEADACRPPVSGQPLVFGAPPSATFSGAGNLPPVAPVKPVVLTVAQKRAAALKACHRYKVKRKRVVCERRVRRRYPVKQSRRASARKGGRK